MKTISIRDLRQRWPEAEAALQIEEEIVITRDSRPVAKLVRIAQQKPKRKRWNPEKHMRWLHKIYGNKMLPSSDAKWVSARADRWEKDSV